MEARRLIPHYTIDDYAQWEGDWELWDGLPVAMTPSPGLPHQTAAANLTYRLRDQLEQRGGDCHCKLFYETDWHVARDTVVRPNILIMCNPVTDEFITRAPTLIVEVLSPSTAEKDRSHKRLLYAAQGVAYYLLADPGSRTVECLRLENDTYAASSIDRLELHDGCLLGLSSQALASLWD